MFEDGVAAYERGDYSTALRLLLPHAEHGHPNAQAYLGAMHANGEGVPQDFAEAEIWYRKAAEQNDADTQYQLGSMYSIGLGIPKDHAEAARWVRKAAEQGFAKAQNHLGSSYVTGEGVPKDYVSAHMWFDLAAAQGHENAQEKRDIVAKRLTLDQIAEAQRMASEWLEKHQQ